MAAKSPSTPTTLSTKREVAQRLHLALGSVNTLIAEGELTAIRVGRRSVRISDADVDAFLQRRIAQAVASAPGAA
ncbi:excisionase family DNA-binding protein [Polaromonas sp. C04]|uniref:helix-turn-helix transcriptional regulator n=1 Tax=Polaromonas sp. C04 TaxID=1945857 RepID=UPI0009855A01|nr:excisionase family DNA-binding protein [Polaromonas sp. C04]